jgi:OFA family oxalate/formate antiporter-like MFS transporter
MPISATTLKMLTAVGVLYLIMMGSTFSSLGVVIPHIIATLHLSFGQAGFGFTLLALAAGTSSMLPSVIIKQWSGRITLLLGVLTMMLAYATLAVSWSAAVYYLGALLLGIGFSLIGAVPALHILGGWEQRKRSLVFGAYLAFGGLGGLLWPSVVELAIAVLGDWRAYWWFMVGLMAVAGTISLLVVRENPNEAVHAESGDGTNGWTLAGALRTPQFYIIGCGIAATYLVATIVNAFTVSHLTMIGVAVTIALVTFSIQSACHAAFPLLMGGIAERVGVRALLVFGLAIQAIGMTALAVGSSLPVLIVFAIGVGGGYGTIFLATTLSLQEYFGRGNYAQIFGANQLFTTISVIGPAIAGWVADATGRFDISFGGCVVMLLAAAIGAATLRPPERRTVLVPATLS